MQRGTVNPSSLVEKEKGYWINREKEGSIKRKKSEHD